MGLELNLSDRERDLLLCLLAANPPAGSGRTANSAALAYFSEASFGALYQSVDDKLRSADRPSGSPPRVDARGRARAGSQRQIQTYLNDDALRGSLDAALAAALPACSEGIAWSAPLAEDGYAEPRDETFWPAIGRADLREEFAGWWPSRGGPAWDAVGRTPSGAVVLVEAKAHPKEFEGGGLGATNSESAAKIEAALERRRRALGAGAPLANWLGPHYQLANRLAWTLRLRELGQPAVLAYVCFSGDATNIPASAEGLEAAAAASFGALGAPAAAFEGWAATIVLPAAE